MIIMPFFVIFYKEQIEESEHRHEIKEFESPEQLIEYYHRGEYESYFYIELGIFESVVMDRFIKRLRKAAFSTISNYECLRIFDKKTYLEGYLSRERDRIIDSIPADTDSVVEEIIEELERDYDEKKEEE